MNEHTYTERERIIKAKIDLNVSHPFFSYILMNMNIEKSSPDENNPSMGINEFGRLSWNEEFVKKMNDKELNGVLCHEAMHMVTLFFQRLGRRDRTIWNMASDLVINALILKEGLTLPDGVLKPDKNGNFEFNGKDGKKVVIEKVVEKTADEIYDIFINNAQRIKTDYNAPGDGSYDGDLDKHDHDSNGGKEGKEGEEGKGKGKGKEEGDNKEKQNKKNDKSQDQSAKNANKEKWKKIAVEAAMQSKMRGGKSCFFDRYLDELLNPEIDWRAQLHQFITKDIPVDFTMKMPGRRSYSTGVYYPSVIRENLEVIIAVDTSGSIGQNEYAAFLTEVVNLAKSFEQINLSILYWSTEVTDIIKVNRCDAHDVIKFKPGSTGGTHMSCVKKYMDENKMMSRVVVFLTDGYIESDPILPEAKLLFVLPKGGSKDIVKKYGPVCKLKLN